MRRIIKAAIGGCLANQIPPVAAPATPTFSQVGVAVKAAASATLDVPWPTSGIVDGDLGLILVSSNLVLLNNIDDWDTAHEIYQASQGALDFYCGYAWQGLKDTDNGGSVAITFATPTNCVGCSIVFRGVNGLDTPPFDTFQHSEGTSDTPTGPSFTTAGANRLLLYLLTVGRGLAVPLFTGMTERMDVNGTGGGTRNVVDELAVTSASTVSGIAVGSALNGGTDDWVIVALALYG